MLSSDSDVTAGLSQPMPDDPFCMGHVAAYAPGAFCLLTHCHTHLTRVAALTTLSSREEREYFLVPCAMSTAKCRSLPPPRGGEGWGEVGVSALPGVQHRQHGVEMGGAEGFGTIG